MWDLRKCCGRPWELPLIWNRSTGDIRYPFSWDSLQFRLTSILYTRDHYWVQKETKNATHFKVGLSDYAQDSYGDFVMVEIDRLNEEVVKDGSLLWAFQEELKFASRRNRNSRVRQISSYNLRAPLWHCAWSKQRELVLPSTRALHFWLELLYCKTRKKPFARTQESPNWSTEILLEKAGSWKWS